MSRRGTPERGRAPSARAPAAGLCSLRSVFPRCRFLSATQNATLPATAQGPNQELRGGGFQCFPRKDPKSPSPLDWNTATDGSHQSPPRRRKAAAPPRRMQPGPSRTARTAAGTAQTGPHPPHIPAARGPDRGMDPGGTCKSHWRPKSPQSPERSEWPARTVRSCFAGGLRPAGPPRQGSCCRHRPRKPRTTARSWPPSNGYSRG